MRSPARCPDPMPPGSLPSPCSASRETSSPARSRGSCSPTPPHRSRSSSSRTTPSRRHRCRRLSSPSPASRGSASCGSPGAVSSERSHRR
uniref:Uncharacterized protein n=1 Tax=Arundo donax TaxID=35708 RepID=A0A0A9BSE7_ARUDO